MVVEINDGELVAIFKRLPSDDNGEMSHVLWVYEYILEKCGINPASVKKLNHIPKCSFFLSWLLGQLAAEYEWEHRFTPDPGSIWAKHEFETFWKLRDFEVEVDIEAITFKTVETNG